MISWPDDRVWAYGYHSLGIIDWVLWVSLSSYHCGEVFIL